MLLRFLIEYNKYLSERRYLLCVYHYVEVKSYVVADAGAYVVADAGAGADADADAVADAVVDAVAYAGADVVADAIASVITSNLFMRPPEVGALDCRQSPRTQNRFLDFYAASNEKYTG